MIEVLEYITVFCFWLFLALVLGSLCAIGIWALVIAVRSLRRQK